MSEIKSVNKIKPLVSKEINYVYHMLSVAKCGYDNSYGQKYSVFHPQEDLALLHRYEYELTIKGGEHIGALYGMFAFPVQLNSPASECYKAMGELFASGDIAANTAKYIGLYSTFLPGSYSDVEKGTANFYDHYKAYAEPAAKICDVMVRNYNIFSDSIWPMIEPDLLDYASSLEKLFEANGLSQKLEDITHTLYEGDAFYAALCASMAGGAEAIDSGDHLDIFGIDRDLQMSVSFIGHEFTIYLLLRALKGTTAFSDFKYWGLCEGLAEFYLDKTLMSYGLFAEQKEYMEFYASKYSENPKLTAKELYLAAEQRFTANT